jgi:hypothetical protein
LIPIYFCCWWIVIIFVYDRIKQENVDDDGDSMMMDAAPLSQTPTSSLRYVSHIRMKIRDQTNNLNSDALFGKKRGRKVGSGIGERKKTEEYSTNPHTLKARKRKLEQDDLSRQVDRARVADATAVSRARNNMKRSTEYQNATHDEKILLDNTIKATILEKRYCNNLCY